MKTFANIAAVGAMVPGPIGMISAGVSAAAYAAAGDRKQACIMAAGVALAAVGAGAAVTTYRAAKAGNATAAIARAAKLSKLDQAGSVGRNIKVNQIQRDIATGKAPKRITMAHTGKIFREQAHVHFKSVGGQRQALNVDGSWKHGGMRLTKKETQYLRGKGWRI